MDKEKDILPGFGTNPFRIPENYFSEMEDGVRARIAGEADSMSAGLIVKLKPAFFMAVSFVIIIAAGAGFMKLVTPVEESSNLQYERDFLSEEILMPDAINDFLYFENESLFQEVPGPESEYDEEEVMDFLSESLSMVSLDYIIMGKK